MTFTCLIIEHDPKSRNTLKQYLRFIPNMHLRACCSLKEFFTIMSAERVDLIFIDIGNSKFINSTLYNKLEHKPEVIFTSSKAKTPVNAFCFNAIDYLLKPITIESFFKAVSKFTNTKPSKSQNLDDTFLLFNSQRKKVKVFLNSVLYIESAKDYIMIYRTLCPPLKTKESISRIETLLPRNHFLRIHRSFIVAINKISAYNNHEVQINNQDIPIGRTYAHVIHKISCC
ncbi:LytR/AlgR family response regulator transcription factor [Formosa sp. A9]|uniref:LytR/AlgR family response regulator transcription factor n=1 Tax=Formosa sp. A9 TaxID=3442641 RepID=UPI003EC027F6